MSIYLLIKGDTQAASRAAEARGIRTKFAYANGAQEEIMLVAENADRKKVTAWFLEDVSQRPPYAIGTLLFYNAMGVPPT